MRRALKLIIIAAIILAFVWWIAELPGTVTADAGPYVIQTGTPIAILLVALLALLFTILFRVIGGIRSTPAGVSAWRGGRARRLGQTATERGIVALAAGDAKAASAEAARAKKLLGETPLVLLLTAESARLAGDGKTAAAAFTKLTTIKDMAFLGHRGLLRHHSAAGDHATAETHALAAEDAYPGATWTRGERLALALKKQDWRAALRLTKTPNEVAAIATAASADAPDQTTALSYAKQAVKAAPNLAPAVIAYAKALRAKGKNRAAKKILANGWVAAPHPLIAASYLAPVTDPIERVQAASELAAAKPGDGESELLLAETSLKAKLTGEARRHALAAINAGLTDRRPYAVLTALGDSPVDAEAPKWTCSACYTQHMDWHPTCPACAKPGTLIWKTPGTALVTIPAGSAAIA
jgi:HemY protein